MRIRQPSRKPTPRPSSRYSWGTRAAIAAVAALLFVGLAVVFVSLGIAFREHIRPQLQTMIGGEAGQSIVPGVLAAPGNALRAIFDPEPVPEIFVDISFRNLQKIRAKRAEALAAGVLMASTDDLVPASIRYGGRIIPVKLRLKGDFADHFSGDKWSLRIHTRKGDQLFGMRRFSIQAPGTRAFQAQPIVFEHLRREGVLVPRYFFVDVTINGNNVGLMALEEHFSKELLESQQSRQGVIVRFDEDPFFLNHLLNGNFGPYSNPFTATIKPFRSSQIRKSKVLSSQLATATGLLRGFVAGTLPASDVFDIELTARFLAVAEIWNTPHLLAWHNLRFYLNPLTMRLEPVGFDVGWPTRSGGLASRRELVAARILDDPEVLSAFLRNLERIVGEVEAGSVQAWVREVEEPLLRVIHREYPFRLRLDLRAMETRAAQLRPINRENLAHFEPFMGHVGMQYPEPVRVYLHRDGSGARIEFVNTLPVEVEVTSLRFSGLDAPFDPLELEAPQQLPITLPPTGELQVPTRVLASFAPPPGGKPFGVEGTAVVKGQSGRKEFRAKPYFDPLTRSPIPTASLARALERHSFLEWEPDLRSLRAKPGRWSVAGSLVLPDGVGLVLERGTTLRFGAGEALVATGPLVFSGTRDEPVVLEGAGPAGANTWGGIVGLHSDRPHVWSGVVVRNTTGIDRDGWKLTGGVTLRAAETRIASTRFEGNRAEDALNLVRSPFVLEGVDFFDAASDGLDVDFSSGTIDGGHYARIGGDAIDVSGAQVGIERVQIEEVHDKGVSVGEASQVEARHLRIDRTGTAAVSKDLSSLLIEDSEISDAVHAGLMAYVKKPEYGPGSVVARNVEMHNVTTEAIVQTGSRIVVDDREIEPRDLDVDQLYAVGPMRK